MWFTSFQKGERVEGVEKDRGEREKKRVKEHKKGVKERHRKWRHSSQVSENKEWR